MAKPITIDGVRYRSIKSAADALAPNLGISPCAVSKRIQAGWSIEKAFSDPRDETRDGEPVVVDGIKYPSLTAAAAERAASLGVSINTIVSRVWNKGWDIESAFSVGRKPFRSVSPAGTRTRLSRLWSSIKYRCGNPSHKKYKYYGGKGVRVYPEWAESFDAFRQWALPYLRAYAEQHGSHAKMSIDRIDSAKGYEPGNVQFITRSENSLRRWG